MFGLRIGEAMIASARIATRAGLIAAALALLSGGAAAIECPKGMIASGNSCRICYECNLPKPAQTAPRAPAKPEIGPCSAGLTAAYLRTVNPPPGFRGFGTENGKTCYIQAPGTAVAPPPRAPATAAPAPCSAGLVARYMAQMSQQPAARRPAPGSVVALTENGTACVFQMPSAVAAPPPQQRVIVGTQTVDGQTYTFIRVEPVTPLPPSGNYNQFLPAFGPWAAQVGRSVEDHLFVHQNYIGPNGEPVMVASPYITDGVINAAETSARLSQAGMQAGANWVNNNKAGIAAMAVAIMVSTALPAAPIAAWVLGGEAAAAGTVAEAVIGGMIYSGTEGAVKSVISDFGSNKSAGQQFMNALGSGGAAALGSIPGSIVGTNVTSLFSPFVAQKTASVIGWGAGKGVDKAVDALGITPAAQTVLSGGFDDPGPQPGGTVLRAAPLSNESLSPRPASK